MIPAIRQFLNALNKGIIWMMILPIKFYRYSISPLFPNSCRHTPTCSEYAMEALRVHGIFKGSLLAIWRILRCNPWGTHGLDPVPPKKPVPKTLNIAEDE
ncbi:MAG: membrane protein insertion efficiency factor YidD [Bacteroidales bacterium]|nr:membrane protein insertion efficiency factor YidD [Bacteroidales bacterium]